MDQELQLINLLKNNATKDDVAFITQIEKNYGSRQYEVVLRNLGKLGYEEDDFVFLDEQNVVNTDLDKYYKVCATILRDCNEIVKKRIDIQNVSFDKFRKHFKIDISTFEKADGLSKYLKSIKGMSGSSNLYISPGITEDPLKLLHNTVITGASFGKGFKLDKKDYSRYSSAEELVRYELNGHNELYVLTEDDIVNVINHDRAKVRKHYGNIRMFDKASAIVFSILTIIVLGLNAFSWYELYVNQDKLQIIAITTFALNIGFMVIKYIFFGVGMYRNADDVRNILVTDLILTAFALAMFVPMFMLMYVSPLMCLSIAFAIFALVALIPNYAVGIEEHSVIALVMGYVFFIILALLSVVAQVLIQPIGIPNVIIACALMLYALVFYGGFGDRIVILKGITVVLALAELIEIAATFAQSIG